jgi:PilZ domain-containing protein
MLQPISLREIAALPVQVRDISVTGVGLLSRTPVAPATFLFVELQSMLDGTARRLRGRVIHATRQRNGIWLLGCALTDELTLEELQGLL